MTDMGGLRGTTQVDLHGLRVAGSVMLAAAALGPLPGPDGFPCPLRSLTGVPCPFCGMTTSVTAAVHLDPMQAVAATPAGLVAVVIAVGLLVFRDRQTADVPVWAAPAGLVAMWLWQLVRVGLL